MSPPEGTGTAEVVPIRPSANPSRGSGIAAGAVEDPLERLLHRCHRDELLPLAELAGVSLDLGLGDLANQTARAVRRMGRHGLANAAFGKGEGPLWREILGSLGGGYLPPGATDADYAASEMVVVRATAAKAWDRLPVPGRREIWTGLGLADMPDTGGDEAMSRAETELGRGFGYRLTTSPTVARDRRAMTLLAVLAVSPCWWLLGPGLVLVGTALVWWSMRSDRQRLLAAVMHVARLRQICLRRVTIGLVGSPSSGKDSGIKALFGIDSGNISPIAGSTRQVSIQRVPGATALFVVNTPGLGDVVQAVTDEAKQILRHIDLYVYVVNSNGGVQARELEDYRACVASQKPVVAVLNKIDLMARPGEREKILAHSLATLGCAPEDLLCVAFAPKPVLSPNPIGIAELRAWLRAALVELGKDPAELDVASSTDPSAAPTLPGPAAPPLSPASSSPTT